MRERAEEALPLPYGRGSFNPVFRFDQHNRYSHLSPVASRNQTLYLIDAHSLIFQVFHAIPEMSSPSGIADQRPVRLLPATCSFSRDKKPDYLICAFDRSGTDVPRRNLSGIQGAPRRRCPTIWCRKFR